MRKKFRAPVQSEEGVVLDHTSKFAMVRTNLVEKRVKDAEVVLKRRRLISVNVASSLVGQPRPTWAGSTKSTLLRWMGSSDADVEYLRDHGAYATTSLANVKESTQLHTHCAHCMQPFRTVVRLRYKCTLCNTHECGSCFVHKLPLEKILENEDPVPEVPVCTNCYESYMWQKRVAEWQMKRMDQMKNHPIAYLHEGLSQVRSTIQKLIPKYQSTLRTVPLSQDVLNAAIKLELVIAKSFSNMKIGLEQMIKIPEAQMTPRNASLRANILIAFRLFLRDITPTFAGLQRRRESLTDELTLKLTPSTVTKSSSTTDLNAKSGMKSSSSADSNAKTNSSSALPNIQPPAVPKVGVTNTSSTSLPQQVASPVASESDLYDSFASLNIDGARPITFGSSNFGNGTKPSVDKKSGPLPSITNGGQQSKSNGTSSAKDVKVDEVVVPSANMTFTKMIPKEHINLAELDGTGDRPQRDVPQKPTMSAEMNTNSLESRPSAVPKSTKIEFPRRETPDPLDAFESFGAYVPASVTYAPQLDADSSDEEDSEDDLDSIQLPSGKSRKQLRF